jgi:hypothetical protein
VVANQWAITTNLLIDDLARLPRSRVIGLNYADFLANPQAVMQRLSAAIDVDWDVELPPTLPLSKTTYSKPAPDKWRRFESEIAKVMPIVQAADAKAFAFLNASQARN